MRQRQARRGFSIKLMSEARERKSNEWERQTAITFITTRTIEAAGERRLCYVNTVWHKLHPNTHTQTMARRKLAAAGLQAPISNDKQQLAKPTQVAAADSREEEQDWYTRTWRTGVYSGLLVVCCASPCCHVMRQINAAHKLPFARLSHQLVRQKCICQKLVRVSFPSLPITPANLY